MKLDQYFQIQGLRDEAFARLIGVSGAAVQRYRKGKRRPTLEIMQKIAAITDGQVTANDFWLGDPPEKEISQ